MYTSFQKYVRSRIIELIEDNTAKTNAQNHMNRFWIHGTPMYTKDYAYQCLSHKHNVSPSIGLREDDVIWLAQQLRIGDLFVVSA